jgi:PGF-pre-PGF domain-containing protein
LNKKGLIDKISLFSLIFLITIVILIFVIPAFADVYPGELQGYNFCDGDLCPAWVNLTRGDMYFADGNSVYIIANISCALPPGENICNASMTVDANFSQVGGNELRHGIFKENGTDASWAIFEFNDTINFSHISGSIIMSSKNITMNATVFNTTAGQNGTYELSNMFANMFAPVLLVNMSTIPGCPSPTEPLPTQIPLLNGTFVNIGACWDGNCTVEDRAQIMNATHYAICVPTFGGDTTNFTALADTGNFSNFHFVIEIPGKAKINYTENVSIDTPEKSRGLFDIAMENIMAGPRVEINDTEWNGSATKPNLNLSAIITFYNVSSRFGIQGRPQIFRYAHGEMLGVPCPPSICSDFVWDGENITFTVTSFSDYGISDAINVTLQSPTNLSYTNTRNVNFTFIPEWNSFVTMDNCTLYGNFTNGWAANETNQSALVSGTINGINNTVSADGPYLWNIYCYNDSSQYDFYTPNWTVIVDTTNPTFANNNSNTSSINSTYPVLIYANWSDDVGLNYSWLSTNETGNWFNYTDGTYSSPYDINLSAGETWSNFTWDNNTFESGVVAWKIYANDSAGNENVTGNMTFTVNDTIAPRYSNNSTNTTAAGVPTLFSLQWVDYAGLSGYIFSFDNCSGGLNLSNNTWVSMTGATNWSNVTNTTNYTAGCNVSWKVYANDTSNNWNSTGIMNYTAKNVSGLYCTEAAQCIGGYCVHYVCRASSTYCGDGYCDSGETCSADCGTGGITGGTGGLTGTTVSTAVIKLTADKVNITMSSIIPTGKMIANIAKYYDPDKDTGIRQLNITVVNNVANIKIMITKLPGLPSTVSYEIEGKVYRYINIEKINITNADINKTFIKFAVNKTWLTDNNVDASNIALYKWSDNRWNELTTTKVDEDEREVFYTAESPGLSVFVIGTKGGAPEVEEVPITGEEEVPTTEEGAEEAEVVGFPIWSALIIVIVIIVVAVLIFFKRDKIKPFLSKFRKKKATKTEYVYKKSK